MYRPAIGILGLLFALAAAQGPLRVGPLPGGGWLLPTWQQIHPAGETLTFRGRPVDLILSPDGNSLFAKDNRGLVVVDTASWKLAQELRFPSGGGGSMHGLAVSKDGRRVYATTAEDSLWEARRVDGSGWEWGRRISLPGPGGRGASTPCGIALSGDGKTAFVCLSRRNSLGIVDLESAVVSSEINVGVAPFDVVLEPGEKRAWVSDWGGRRPLPGELSAPSSGTPALIDARGVASSGVVSLVDLAARREVRQVPVGLHPSDLALRQDGRELYVANANSDTVSIIDTREARLLSSPVLRLDPGLPFGSAPDALALSGSEDTLYVANAGNNAVAVVRLDPSRRAGAAIRGFIPTAWYPSALAVRSDWIYVACAKGFGSRARKAGAPVQHVRDALGTIGRVRVPLPADLERYTAQVRLDARAPSVLAAAERARSAAAPVPVPRSPGEPSAFEHVFYVIKENRTYDQVLGDLTQGNGDPKLCVYPRRVTPNHHALAEQFALLDNFYCNGVLSADGHSWVTEGNVADYLEKSFGGFTRSYTFGDDPLTYSSSGFLWDGALEGGLSVRNYGEFDYAGTLPAGSHWLEVYRDYTRHARRITLTHNIGVDKLRRYSSDRYPGWNLAIPDVLRADVFLQDLASAEKKGSWPNLTLVYLPNDHTSGTSPGAPTPRAQMADNDLALGRVVEGITRSRFWPKTCIFVIEDDPQDGFDHVDGHRSLCLVVSPYTRRGAVVSRFYNQTSVLRTMERILGLPPMNQFDALSPLMEDCFTAKPDVRPYAALPNGVPLDEMNPPAGSLKPRERAAALRSLSMDFRHPDAANEDSLNRILWSAAMGEAPYPAQNVGARSSGRDPDD